MKEIIVLITLLVGSLFVGVMIGASGKKEIKKNIDEVPDKMSDEMSYQNQRIYTTEQRINALCSHLGVYIARKPESFVVEKNFLSNGGGGAIAPLNMAMSGNTALTNKSPKGK